jgi:hypothetical protein
MIVTSSYATQSYKQAYWPVNFLPIDLAPDPGPVCSIGGFSFHVVITKEKAAKTGGLFLQHVLLFFHANVSLRRDCRKATPRPAKPSSIIAQVIGWGGRGDATIEVETILSPYTTSG